MRKSSSWFLHLIILVHFNFSFSQIEEPKTMFSKIYFKYKIDSNYIFDEKGIYADPFLLKKDFPNLTYELMKSPKDSLKQVGFILLNKLNNTDRYRLRDVLFRFNATNELEYDVVKKTVSHSKTYMDDIETKKFVRDILKVDSLYFCQTKPSVITYKKNKHYKVKNECINSTESYEDHLIIWEENAPNIGTFNYLFDNYSYTNLIVINPKLDKHINPTYLYANCDYGVKKVISLLFTCDLISVKYE